MFYGAFGGVRQIGETLLRATPLIFTGLAVAYGFRAGLFNIGAEGQLFLGGLAAAFVGVLMAGYPWVVSVPLILLAAMLAGAAWAFIPALMKAKIGAHEVITTMMFTYIGRYLVSWIVTGPFKAEGAIPQTPAAADDKSSCRGSRMSFPFIAQNRAHLGLHRGRRRRDRRVVDPEVHGRSASRRGPWASTRSRRRPAASRCLRPPSSRCASQVRSPAWPVRSR